MEHRSDLVIISVFGRGTWLAAAMARLGLKVTLIESSQQLGSNQREAWHGPFGLFGGGIEETPVAPEGSQQTDSQQEDARSPWKYTAQERHFEAIPEGLVISLPEGVLELQSPLLSYRSQQLGMDEVVFSNFSLRDIKKENYLKKQSFKKTWLSYLSHQLVAPEFQSNAFALESGEPAPLTQPYLWSRKGFSIDDLLNPLKQLGVKVYSDSFIKDVSIHGSAIDGVEIAGPISGVISGRQFVWTLSSLESAFLGQQISKDLFRGKVLKPDWYWTSYLLKWFSLPLADQIPRSMVVLEAIDVPWTHQSMIVLNQEKPGLWRAWVRMPLSQRFHKAYHASIGEGIVHLLRSRFPSLEVEVSENPVEGTENESEVGPVRWPVYSQDRSRAMPQASLKNVHWDGPEIWGRLDLGSQLESQVALASDLKTWWLNDLKKRGDVRDIPIQS